MKNIGILFPNSKKGGVFQYALSIIDGLTSFIPNFNYFVLHYNTENPKESIKNPEKIKFVCLDSQANNILGKIKFLINILLNRPIFNANKKNKEIVKEINLDLLIIPFPLLLGWENKVPYIVSIPDIMHRYYPKFPEYNFRARLKRDFVYNISAKNSLLTIVDSEQGLNDLNKFYKIPREKIKPIPYIPPGYVYEYRDMDLETAESLLKKYRLPQKFLFYPAQFWYHKNHQTLIKAVYLIKNNFNTEISLVLSGDPKANYNNFQKMMDLIKEFSLENQIFNLGYVSNKEIVVLYKKSLALVFPTLIGPTSIPPLEAIILGRPILCSGLFEMPKQIGKAGIFFNPFSEQDMAEKIYQVWSDEKLRKELIKAGKEKAKKITLENYAQKWQAVILEALNKLETEKQRATKNKKKQI